MPFIPATNVVQAELIFSWDGQIVENVLHYQIAGGVDAGAMNEVGTELVAWWDATMQPLVPTTVILTEVRMTDLTTEFAPGVTWTAGLPLVGGHASAAMPNNVALSMTKRTAFRGRSYRGRIYHVGLMESVVTDNMVTTVHRAALVAAYFQIMALTVNAIEAPMVVVSKYEGGVARGTALITVVNNITTDGVIDSQRRRLPRRGT